MWLWQARYCGTPSDAASAAERAAVDIAGISASAFTYNSGGVRAIALKR
ncbi:MAG: hypothetical protein JWM30_176 [Burkholderia sp.]|jgi:hypothetical protein|nr:hypothetical protein [Burkholderia sp.]